MASPKPAPDRPYIKNAVQVAKQTLAAIEAGSYTVDGIALTLKGVEDLVEYYPAESELSSWRDSRPPASHKSTVFIVQEISTIEASSLLYNFLPSNISDGIAKVGTLNFASAKSPGGGFLGGSQAQEESLARSSNLYPTLTAESVRPYYDSHKKNPKNGFYSHAMIYSPRITIFRKDSGEWMNPPVTVDMLTSPAVNAGVARRHLGQSEETEREIAKVMKERMGRILYLFEKKGASHLVLGSFGTGAFRNDVPTIVNIWKEYLIGNDARFGRSFQTVMFAVIGKKNFELFETTWNSS
ncbi:hypothetical protein DL96DRAFT_1010442 [Flagelloscypha sp. PMI_526]|nr:hypothetical protein DL96DRAFT_1010442 [Flagelloscypha sp. PMI_526]